MLKTLSFLSIVLLSLSIPFSLSGGALMDRVQSSSTKNQDSHHKEKNNADHNQDDKHKNNNENHGPNKEKEDPYAAKSTANKKMMGRSQKAQELAQSEQDKSTLSEVGNGFSLSNLSSQAAGMTNLSGSANLLAASQIGSFSSLGGLNMLGKLSFVGLGGSSMAAMLAGGSALKMLSQGMVSSKICFGACNAASCKSDRVRSLCQSKCGDNPASIKKCLAQGDDL